MKPKKSSTYRTSPLSDFSGDRGIYEYEKQGERNKTKGFISVYVPYDDYF